MRSIEKQTAGRDGALVLRCDEPLDRLGAAALCEAMTDLPSEGTIVLDLLAVDFMDSGGARAVAAVVTWRSPQPVAIAVRPGSLPERLLVLLGVHRVARLVHGVDETLFSAGVDLERVAAS